MKQRLTVRRLARLAEQTCRLRADADVTTRATLLADRLAVRRLNGTSRARRALHRTVRRREAARRTPGTRELLRTAGERPRRTQRADRCTRRWHRRTGRAVSTVGLSRLVLIGSASAELAGRLRLDRGEAARVARLAVRRTGSRLKLTAGALGTGGGAIDGRELSWWRREKHQQEPKDQTRKTSCWLRAGVSVCATNRPDTGRIVPVPVYLGSFRRYRLHTPTANWLSSPIQRHTDSTRSNPWCSRTNRWRTQYTQPGSPFRRQCLHGENSRRVSQRAQDPIQHSHAACCLCHRPTSQSLQEDCPVRIWLLPGAQPMHPVVPLLAWYLPEGSKNEPTRSFRTRSPGIAATSLWCRLLAERWFMGLTCITRLARDLLRRARERLRQTKQCCSD
jgi:hypothetical protein